MKITKNGCLKISKKEFGEVSAKIMKDLGEEFPGEPDILLLFVMFGAKYMACLWEDTDND